MEMFVDRIICLLEQRKPIRLLSPSVDEAKETAELAELREQMNRLPGAWSNMLVQNFHDTLFPSLPPDDSPLAVKKNAEKIADRDTLIRLSNAAPLGPPFEAFTMEYRHLSGSRYCYLILSDRENKKYTVTQMFEGKHDPVEFWCNAFEIHFDPEAGDMFTCYAFLPELEARGGFALQAAKEGAVTVRTAIQCVNWPREDVPLVTLVGGGEVPVVVGKPKPERKAKTPGEKSNPTLIKFSPFVKAMRAGRRDTESRGERAISQHPVRGTYVNVSFDHPWFGHRPIFGKTYGRIWRRQHLRGNRKYGVKKSQRAILTVGDLTDPSKGEINVVTPTVPPASVPEKKDPQLITHGDSTNKKTGSEDR
jgi:hypothetical protein